MAKGFMDGYKTYDTSKGFGSRKKWQRSFDERMGSEEAQLIMADEKETPYSLLGLPEGGATAAEIKKAFRNKMMEWHPDRNPHRLEEAEAMSKKIIAAYTILSQ